MSVKAKTNSVFSWDDDTDHATAVASLVGKYVTEVSITDDREEMFIRTSDGCRYRFYHDQDCCETAAIETMEGDPVSMVGHTITLAEVATPDLPPPEICDDSWTWTIYKFATMNGYVTIRWCGQSNGYYGEQVDLEITCGGDDDER